MLEILLDAFLDSLKLLIVLVPMYILIELIERRGLKYFIRPLASKWSVFAGAGLGIIPQCGFSVVACKLYVKKLIPLGALIAVFIAASDEAVPILLTKPLKLLPLLGIKICMALVAGFSVNFAVSRFNKRRKALVANATNSSSLIDNHNLESSAAAKDSALTGSDAFITKNEIELPCLFGCHNHEIGNCKNEHHQHGFFKSYLLHPLIHIASVFVFILLVNIAFGIIINAVGEQQLENFMQSNGALQPLFASLVGLIPNCASSVTIAQMYSLNKLNLGAAVAGLSINAGVSYIVLIKEHKNRFNCFLIIGGLFLYSLLTGTLIYLISTWL